MSEQTTTETVAEGEAVEAEAANVDQAQQGDPADKPLGAAGEKALREEREARAAAEREARAEKQRASDLEAGQQAAITAGLRAHLIDVHAISEDDAALFLTAGDAETLLKQVTALAAKNAESKTADASVPAGPRADLTQGSGREKPKGTPEGDFANWFKQQIPG